MVDSGDAARLTDCRDELWALLAEERLAGATLLVLANKQDIGGAMRASDLRAALRLDDITTHAWRIQPCSAVTGEHLIDGLDWAIKDVASRIYYYGATGV